MLLTATPLGEGGQYKKPKTILRLKFKNKLVKTIHVAIKCFSKMENSIVAQILTEKQKKNFILLYIGAQCNKGSGGERVDPYLFI